MEHELKTGIQFADAIAAGDKTFEVRLNDRGYQKGDTVRFVGDGPAMAGHPILGRTYLVTYVLSGWGVEGGYVAFGIREDKP